MAQRRIVSYLRTLRKKSNLSQRELAQLLGYSNEVPVSRHERGVTVPPFRIALSYQVIFKVPASDIFPSISQTIEQNIETKLARMEAALGAKSAKDPDAVMTALTLQFLAARKKVAVKSHTQRCKNPEYWQ